MSDVLQGITEKMIRRHPHVFGEAQVSSSEEVRDRWHETKMAEAKDNGVTPSSFLDSVPQKLPALMRAYRISERAAKFGVNRTNINRVFKRLDQEVAGLKSVVKTTNSEKLAERFGGLLFTMVNLARSVRVHPETALARTISRFVKRFNIIEESLRGQGRTLESASLEEMDTIWEKCK